MADLVLVRHGETVWHAQNRYAGTSDIALSARGEEQGRLLAVWAATAGLAAVFSSRLERARRTAVVCAEAVSVRAQVDDRLGELDFGAGEGLTAAEMAARFAGAREAFRRDPVANHLPGGEDPVLATERFTACLREIAAEHSGARVLVVAHTTVIRLALCSLLGLPLNEYRRLFPAIANCALTEIRLDGDLVALLQLNTPTEGSPA
jgi:probable phosphoglycerate mutase